MKKVVHFRIKKRKFSFDKKESSINNRFDIQRILSVRKMNREEKNIKDINKEINDYFSSPDKYFQKNSPVTIGKKIYILDMNDPKLRRSKKLKTEKKMASNIIKNIANNNNPLTHKINKNDLNIINKPQNGNKRKESQVYLDMSSKFEVIDNDQLKMIFNSFKINDKIDKLNNDKSELSSLNDSSSHINNINSNEENNYFRNKLKIKKNIKNLISSMDDIPIDIKNSLSLQNKKLNLQKLSEKQNMHMARYLSKKINNPQNNLLLNKIDSFRFKKEIINEIEFNKPFEDRYGKFKWNVSLRRPENFQGVRESYINLKGERFLPFWSLVVERYPKQKEMCVKPGHILNDNEINEIKKQNYKMNSGNKNQYFKTVENLEDLSIEGKNLYDIEYKREIIDSKNKKILHKVFVENGKAISSNDINNLYGHDTFYKDYKGLVTEKNPSFHKNHFRDNLQYI